MTTSAASPSGELALMPVRIQNRRYLGNKFRLLPQLEAIVKEKCGGAIRSFCDLFAGTGVVGHRFNAPDRRIIANDLLYSNYVPLYAWLAPENFRRRKLQEILRHLNALEPDGDNYMSRHYGGTYFSMDNARKIGAIREEIDVIERQEGLNFKEKCILLTSLLYAMDKVANTCGHYDAFRRKLDTWSRLELRMPYIEQEKNRFNEIHCADANQLARSLSCDVLYIDPPYNSRQYSDTYHLLENVMKWEKPPVYGVARKMDRSAIKSEYCLKRAPQAFEELIASVDCRYILVSYNNMAEKGDGRSNARITDEQIMESLSRRGDPLFFEFDYRQFTTGKSSLENHTERVFFVEVKKR
jgi:adenine-specific DNA-methyltransferase